MATIDRSGATALIPEDYSREIIKNVPSQSIALSMLRKLPNMSSKQQRMPVLNLLPTASFVNGDTGLKTTTTTDWTDKYIDAEEIAVIVPIPEAVLEDADYDLWGEVRPELEAAIARLVDAAIFFGTSKPAAWPTGIAPAAVAAGNVVDVSDWIAVVGQEDDDLYDMIAGPGGVMDLLTGDGFRANGFVADGSFEAQLRGLRDLNNRPLYADSMTGASPNTLLGNPIRYDEEGIWDSTYHMIAGAWNKAVYSIRKDVTYKTMDQATIHDTDGQTVLYNLAQQDMVALRVVMRLGWQVPNPVNAKQPVAANRYPFSVLQP